MKNWNELSIRDKNDIIKVAVQNGITTLPEIRERYNEFAEGGNLSLREEEYQDRIRQVAKENWRNWGYNSEEEAYRDQLNNPTYDYRSFYANNPGADNNANTHWPDTYKAASHPTFSNESIYSGNVHPIYNPSGARGGRWDEKGYVPHGDTLHVPFNMLASGGKIHIKPSHRGKFTALKERTGHSASWFKAHGTPAQRKMATFELNARKWKHGDGGHLYDGESENTQQMDIANSYPMSLQDYIAQRIQDKKDSAINVMRNREEAVPVPLNIRITKEEALEEVEQEVFNMQQRYNKAYIDLLNSLNSNSIDIKYRQNEYLRLKRWLEEVENRRDNIRNHTGDFVMTGDGATCINTYTDSYGKDRKVSGNQTWLAKGKSGKPVYEEKGFKKLSPNDRLQPADMIQSVSNDTRVPFHAVMFERYRDADNKGDRQIIEAIYSNGSHGSGSMKSGDYIYAPYLDNAFRFIGNAADSARWTKEYNELMQNGPIVEKALGGHLFDGGGETEEEYYPIWLDGVTVKPSGNRPTTRDDWNWANWRELQNEREQQAAESVRRGIDRNGTPIAAGIYGLAAAPFSIESLGSSAVANGVRTGLQAMNTAFTPSTWLNPVTGAKLLSPTVGTIADAGVQGAFAYEGLNGLWNQGRQGTLLSDPASTLMHGLEVLPMVGVGARGTQYMYNKAKPFMNFLWNDGNIIQRKMPYNPNNFYREVSKEAIDDAISSGVVRTGNPDRYLGPFFAKGSTPWRREKFIIEGYPDKNEWIYAEPYQNAIWLGEEYPALGKKAMEEALNHVPKPQDASIGVHIFPYTNGSVNLTPTSNFTYWQKHPIIGWRQHAFDNTARAKQAYGTPKADIMPVEGSITTGDIPNITPENAASITPAQWTAAQDAAIARGDVTEVQRLRDLHSSLTPTTTPGKYYRGTKVKQNSYPNRHIDEEVGEMNGIYFTKKPKYASRYGDVEQFYLNTESPLQTKGSWTGVIDDATRAEIEKAGYDAVENNMFDTDFLSRLFRSSRDETILFNGKKAKLADAVTYDDNGIRIPLGDRDNFSNPDIRWGLLPWILGGGASAIGYNYLNNQGSTAEYANGGPIVQAANRQ